VPPALVWLPMQACKGGWVWGGVWPPLAPTSYTTHGSSHLTQQDFRQGGGMMVLGYCINVCTPELGWSQALSASQMPNPSSIEQPLTPLAGQVHGSHLLSRSSGMGRLLQGGPLYTTRGLQAQVQPPSRGQARQHSSWHFLLSLNLKTLAQIHLRISCSPGILWRWYLYQ
jgi:hypothetical protein